MRCKGKKCEVCSEVMLPVADSEGALCAWVCERCEEDCNVGC